MPIDSIHRIPNFQVAESNEANDEERRREKQKSRDDRNGVVSKEKKAKPADLENDVLNPETQTLQSQPIDTGKVVELLSHRPETDLQAYSAKIRVISKIANVKKPTLSPVKNLNKSA